MTTTPNLGLKYLSGNQADQTTSMNEDLAELDALTQPYVLTRTLSAPPGSPAAGDRYIVGAGGSGDWSGYDNQVAYWTGAQWRFYAPHVGWRVWVADENGEVQYDGSDWGYVSCMFPGTTGAPVDTPAVRVARVDTATFKLYIHMGAGVWKSTTLT